MARPVAIVPMEGRTPRSGKTHKRLRGYMPAALAARKIAAVGKPTPELVFTLGGRSATVLATLSPRLADAVMTTDHDEPARDAAPDLTGPPTRRRRRAATPQRRMVGGQPDR
jgi:hypothetical protein